MSIAQINGRVIVDGVELPPCPSKSKSVKSCIINGKIYVNGFEFKNGEWKPTLSALWHLLF
jgi:hypothetical protein